MSAPVVVGKVDFNGAQLGICLTKPLSSADMLALQKLADSFTNAPCETHNECLDLLYSVNQEHPSLQLPIVSLSRQVSCYIERQDYASITRPAA